VSDGQACTSWDGASGEGWPRGADRLRGVRVEAVGEDNAEAVSYRGEFALQLVAGATEKAAVRTVQLGSLKAAQCSSERDARSSCVMSRLEIEAIVGLHGESKTKGMGDWMRDQRVRVGQEAEDLVERAQNKFPSFVPQGRKVAA
jgi:hypothetical protein